jgi:hypothetical protein
MGQESRRNGIPPTGWRLSLTLARLVLGPAMLAFAWLDPELGPWLTAPA